MNSIMANITIIGFIDNIRYLQDSVLVFVSEFKKGYKKSDGTIVEDRYLSWKTVWKPYFKKYFNEHFTDGMLVEIKGDVLPFALNHEKIIDGYSVIGQCCNVFSYPRSSVRQEQKMIKESQASDYAIPNLDEFNKPDF